MSAKRLLAFDLGAESGRGILGHLDGQRVSLEVIHRFPNGGVRTLDSLHWDVLRLYREMVETLRLCARQHGHIDSLGVDTWGVDFALLGREGTLLGNPRHHRDPHTEGILEQAFERVSRAEIFQRTGIQFMRFNTLFQLLALQRDRSPLLEVADTLLMMPDLFHYFLTGIKVNEYTNASTTQMLDPGSRQWDQTLMQKFDLPTRMLGTLVAPGTELGPLRPTIATETGINPAPVIAPATHDTGSAIAAVPAQEGTSWAYISSGTWSLMGVELDQPLVNEQALQANYTNEGGVAGTIRFLKNIMGLWLVQEVRRSYERAGTHYEYDELMRLAEQAPPAVSLVNPDDPSFVLPSDMARALRDFCKRTSQPIPEDVGATVRCALESLALCYRRVLEKLETLTGRRDIIHIVGGGSQSELLNQLTADACNRMVIAGPTEATALGNVLIQAMGLGILKSLDEVRQVVRQSFEVKTYTPRNPASWEEPYRRFCGLVGSPMSVTK